MDLRAVLGRDTMALQMHLTCEIKSQTMLRVTTEKKRGKVVLNVEGRLAGESVSALEQCWQELQAETPNQKFQLRLCDVTYIDAAGKALLKEIHRQGARLVAEGCLNQAIVREISGKEEEDESGEKTGRRKGSPIIFYVALFGLVLGAGRAEAQGMRDNRLPPQAPSQVLKLTLDQAVGLALKQNPTAQIAVLTAAQSVQDRNIARAALLPQADLSVKDQVERLNIEAQFGGKKIPGFPEHVGPYQVFSAGPTFGSPILDLTLWKRYQEARDNANASKATSLSTREQV